MAQIHPPQGLANRHTLALTSPIASAAIELSLMIAEINMYEDMFSGFMRMEVVLSDAVGLMDKFPIVGDETLTWTYYLEGYDPYTQIFKIYKVSGRSLDKARAHSMVLHAISLPGYKNSFEYLYKPYIQKKPHEIIDDVCTNYLGLPTGGGQGQKALVTPVPTENTYTRVSSGQNPLQLINFLAAESKSTQAATYKKPSNYVFFEDNKQFNFVPISHLMEQGTIRDFFLGIPSSRDNRGNAINTHPGESILSLRIVDSFDDLDSLHRGTYLNEVNIIDPILKRFKMHPISGDDEIKHEFKYERDFGDLTHLPNSGSKTVSPQSDIIKGKKPYAAHRRMMITQYEKDNETYPVDSSAYFKEMQPFKPGDQLLDPRQRHKNLPESIHEKENLFNHVVEVTVPGDPDVTVGKLVKIKVPQPTSFKDVNDQDYLLLYGQEATFLVTAVRHIYNAAIDSYTMVLSCSAESFAREPAGEKVI